MGLGLAIVSYILKLHHSQLTITSILGEGSAFTFSIDPLHSTPISSHRP